MSWFSSSKVDRLDTEMSRLVSRMQLLSDRLSKLEQTRVAVPCDSARQSFESHGEGLMRDGVGGYYIQIPIPRLVSLLVNHLGVTASPERTTPMSLMAPKRGAK